MDEKSVVAVLISCALLQVKDLSLYHRKSSIHLAVFFHS